jgi:hypothetical protein
MQLFKGQLWESDHVVFDEVTAALDAECEALDDGASGVLEVHQGGLLAGPALPTGGGFRLVLADGTEWPVRLSEVAASDSAGIARMAFRVDQMAGTVADL